MSDFIERILAQKRKELEEKRKSIPLSVIMRKINKIPPSSLFSQSIFQGRAIIAEIKRASPSKGTLFSGDRIKKLVKIYEKYGASAISIVTDEKYFQGSLKDLHNVKSCVSLPLLRKDFIIDEYQILESKVARADALLLITSLLSSKKLKKFLKVAESIGMESVVEIHTQEELKKALNANAKIIGINNRDLRTMKVDLNTSQRILPSIPDSKIKIVESGIKSENDLLSFREFKVNAFLVGEALVTASNPADRLKSFCSLLREK
jgi:indole-3-glycerol phosphate synthase